MQILLIAATKDEIGPEFYKYPGIDVLITGPGIPSTMYHLQKRMQQIDYEFILQAGIAGTFTEDIDLGQVVLVKQDTFGDLGMEDKENFTSIFDSGLCNKDEFPFKNGWLVNTNKIFEQPDLTDVKAISVNKVSESLLQKQQLIKRFDPGIESMEGAALHYVCLQENIPFLQLRSISNYVGERDKEKWKTKEAINNLNTELTKLISRLVQ